ncbi:MAG: TetR/AcrR family transcriptional regulator [Pseudomonadota bacterium]
MAGKVAQRRDALRKKLIDIAEERIAEGGVASVKARDLAKAADCALGAIYNVFGDLHDVIIEVNGRTFRKLGAYVAERLENGKDELPTERLIIMAHAYLDFAADHPNTWRALFDVNMSVNMDVPQWYVDELLRLFGHISSPVKECFPEMNETEVDLMTRALFASVHGNVLLGLENRISAVPRSELKRMLAVLLSKATQ